MLTKRTRSVLTTCLRNLPAVLGVLLLIGALYVVQKEFRHLRLSDIEAALRAIPARALVISFVWTVLSYAVLTIYDRLGTIYAGHKDPTAASPSPRSVPMRCRTTWALPPCRARRCAIGCMRTGD
jgi:hypothetical protein